MRWRDHIALTLPSFFLRLVLALTFLWAGTSKIVGTTTTQGDHAARLANLGVAFLPDLTPTPPPTTPQTTKPTAPRNPLPDTTPQPDQKPDQESDQQLPDPESSETQSGSQSDSQSESEPSTPDPLAFNPLTPRILTVAQVNDTFDSQTPTPPVAAPAVGSDFPNPVRIKRVYTITLMLDRAANPPLTHDSKPITPLLPDWISAGRTTVYAAWAAAITELTCGFLLLIGLLTRISALSLCAVMLVAMWTTSIGPAALQSDNAILGFIPNAADVWDPASYATLLWQLALLVMSLSVALLGAGPLSLDRVLFRPGRRDPYVSGESRPQTAPKAKPIPLEPHKDRSAFDRAPPPKNNPTP